MKKAIVWGLMALTAGLTAACGAAPQGDGSESSSEALILPESQCTLVTGQDTAHLEYTQIKMLASNFPIDCSRPATGQDADVVQFQCAVWRSISGIKPGPWVLNAVAKHWMGEDLTQLSGADYDAVVSLVTSPQWMADSHVGAGIYDCDWLLQDYHLQPGQRLPYLPRKVLAYDPTCSTSGCASGGGSGSGSGGYTGGGGRGGSGGGVVQ